MFYILPIALDYYLCRDPIRCNLFHPQIGQEAEKGDIAKLGQKNKDETKKVQKQERLAKQVANRCEELLPESAKTIQLETAKLEGLRKALEDTANKVSFFSFASDIFVFSRLY